jgi:hypothetical protein
MDKPPFIIPADSEIPERGKNDDLAFCRTMQRWAAQEVDPRNNQRVICISDWFCEEILIGKERTSEKI